MNITKLLQLNLEMTNLQKEKQIYSTQDSLSPTRRKRANTRIIYGLFWHFYSGHLSCSRGPKTTKTRLCPAGWPEPLNHHHSILSPGSGLPDAIENGKWVINFPEPCNPPATTLRSRGKRIVFGLDFQKKVHLQEKRKWSGVKNVIFLHQKDNLSATSANPSPWR